MAKDQNQGRPDDPTRPPETDLAAGGDVGGIPSGLDAGVDRASDRAAARREGGPRSGAGEASAATGEMARNSAATAPRDPRDLTGSAVPAKQGDRMRQESGDRQDRELRPAAGDQGQDDSVPESLGKSIAEPFKSS
jgi:hypothetical protein